MASLHAPGRNHRFSLQVNCADAILDVVVSAMRWAAQVLCTAWHLGRARAQTRRADAAVPSPHLTHERPPGGVAHQHVTPLQQQASDWLRRRTARADLQAPPQSTTGACELAPAARTIFSGSQMKSSIRHMPPSSSFSHCCIAARARPPVRTCVLLPRAADRPGARILL